MGCMSAEWEDGERVKVKPSCAVWVGGWMGVPAITCSRRVMSEGGTNRGKGRGVWAWV